MSNEKVDISREIEEIENDEYKEYLNDLFNSEVGYWLSGLRLLDLPLNWFNTFDWVADLKSKNDDHISISYHVLETLGIEEKPVDERDLDLASGGPSLHEAYANLKKTYSKISADNYDWSTKEHYLHKFPIEQLIEGLKGGVYPSPHILWSLLCSFELYFRAGGDISLEEVFFEKTKQGSGNFSKRRGTYMRYRAFHNQVIRNKFNRDENGKKFTHESLALNIFENEATYTDDGIFKGYIPETIDTFLKGYYRWKKEFDIAQLDKEIRG